MTSNSRNKNQSGFTLLEVLIAMAVLVFISLGIYQATTEAFRLRDILMNEGDFYNGIRLAMDIVQRDVQLIYTPVLMAPPKKEPTPGQPGSPPVPNPQESQEMQTLLSGDLGQTTAFWGPAIDKTGIRPARFQGKPNKMSFITLSHVRIYKNAPESEFAKVSYELQPDQDNRFVQNAQTLVKVESSNAFDDDDRRDKGFRQTYPLLRGITKIQFEYYLKEDEHWYTSWDSEETSDDKLKRHFPDKIKITISVGGPSKLSFEGIYIFRPEVPLRGLDPSS